MIEGNKEQREGFAKAFDTLAVTSIVGAIVGITGHSKLEISEIFCLISITPLFFTLAYFLRSTK